MVVLEELCFANKTSFSVTYYYFFLFPFRNLAAIQVQVHPVNPGMTSNSIVSLPFITLTPKIDFLSKCDLSMLAL